MRSKRSVRLEAMWLEIVAGHPVSGQTIRAFCKARQVTEASFFFWRRELLRRAQPLAASPRLIVSVRRKTSGHRSRGHQSHSVFSFRDQAD